jgi:glycosyltransferase involved in cell wall biosynthesis
VPHKKIEDLLALFAAYQDLNPDSALVVAGRPAVGGYGNYIRYLLDRRYPRLAGRILLTGAVTAGQLKRLYSRASGFVTMSEHEGFCVPLVEAMHFDRPVFAWGQRAVRETLGGSGVVFLEKDPAAMAGEIRRVLGDAAERERVLRAQRERLAGLAAESDGRAVWRFLLAALESHAGPV